MVIASLIIDMSLQFNVDNQPTKMNLTKKKKLWIIKEPTKEDVRVHFNLWHFHQCGTICPQQLTMYDDDSEDDNKRYMRH